MRATFLTVTAAAVLATLATPAMADAAKWRGKTEQRRSVSVRAGDDGVVKRVVLRWGRRAKR
jgi:hypothetical protein